MCCRPAVASPSTIRPRPRLSALVSACRRVNASGKRNRPTVPAMKNTAPALTATMVNQVERRSSATSVSRVIVELALAFTNAIDTNAASSASVSATSIAAAVPVAAPSNNSRRDAAGAEQLRGHHAIDVGGSTQHADAARLPPLKARSPTPRAGSQSWRCPTTRPWRARRSSAADLFDDRLPTCRAQ